MPDESVIDQVTEAVDNVSPETADLSTSTPPAAAPATPSRSERIKALRGPARDHYQRTGNVEEAEAKMTGAPTSSTPAAEPAGTEGESGTPPPQQQPRTSRNEHNFRKVTEKNSQLERELIAAKAKLEIFERQSAASGPSAPATEKNEPKATTDDPRPRPPKFTDPKYDGVDGAAKFDADNEKWIELDTEWLNRQTDRRFTGEQQKQQTSQAQEKWAAQVDGARKQFKDYDQVVLNDTTPISYATLETLWKLDDGAVRGYSLGKDLKLATRIAELTHIPGEHQFANHADFLKWVKSDPDRAMLYGEKLALAKAEVARLSVPNRPNGTAAIPQKPLKEIIRSTPRPSAEVNTDDSAAPTQDPIAVALQNIKLGVRGAQAEYNRLMNEKTLRKRQGR